MSCRLCGLLLLVAAVASAPLARPAGAAVGDITTFTDPAGMVQSPGGITLGPDGAMWFTSDENDRVGRITTAGEITTYPLPAPFVAPTNITTGPDGNLWITVREPGVGPDGQGAIVRMGVDGAGTGFTLPTDGGFFRITEGITPGPDGNVWFTAAEIAGVGDAVGKITTGGAITLYPYDNTGVAGPDDIVTGPDGNLWFTIIGGLAPVGGRLARATTNGDVTLFPDPTGNTVAPEGITVGSDAQLWYVNLFSDALNRATTGGQITPFTDAQMRVDEPIEIAAGPDGNLWFTNSNGNTVGVATTAGEFVAFYGDPTGNVQQPSGIALGPDCALWFTSFENNRIGRVDSGVPPPCPPVPPEPPAPSPPAPEPVAARPTFTG